MHALIYATAIIAILVIIWITTHSDGTTDAMDMITGNYITLLHSAKGDYERLSVKKRYYAEMSQYQSRSGYMSQVATFENEFKMYK